TRRSCAEVNTRAHGAADRPRDIRQRLPRRTVMPKRRDVDGSSELFAQPHILRTVRGTQLDEDAGILSVMEVPVVRGLSVVVAPRARKDAETALSTVYLYELFGPAYGSFEQRSEPDDMRFRRAAARLDRRRLECVHEHRTIRADPGRDLVFYTLRLWRVPHRESGPLVGLVDHVVRREP